MNKDDPGYYDPRLKEPVTVTTQVIVVLAVAGSIVLALKHPSNVGPAREIQEGFLDLLGGLIVRAGVMTQEEFSQFKAGEATIQVETSEPLRPKKAPFYTAFSRPPWRSDN